MLREVSRNDYYRVEFDPEERLLRLTRSATPQAGSEIEPLVTKLTMIVNPLRPARLLIDMRLAPGNNDPKFEQAGIAALQRLHAEFSAVAVLIRSAVGRLHFQRMMRESGQHLHVFFEEAEALHYLREQSLIPPASQS